MICGIWRVECRKILKCHDGLHRSKRHDCVLILILHKLERKGLFCHLTLPDMILVEGCFGARRCKILTFSPLSTSSLLSLRTYFWMSSNTTTPRRSLRRRCWPFWGALETLLSAFTRALGVRMMNASI